MVQEIFSLETQSIPWLLMTWRRKEPGDSNYDIVLFCAKLFRLLIRKIRNCSMQQKYHVPVILPDGIFENRMFEWHIVKYSVVQAYPERTASLKQQNKGLLCWKKVNYCNETTQNCVVVQFGIIVTS